MQRLGVWSLFFNQARPTYQGLQVRNLFHTAQLLQLLLQAEEFFGQFPIQVQT
jgi:hypothetical protein